MPEDNNNPDVPQFLGALIDDRPAEAQLKDINFVELVAEAAPVNWKEKKDSEWRRFTEQNQDGSGSCVAQTIKKLAEVNLYLKEGIHLEFSATPIYAARSNRPGGGMIGVEAFDIWKRDGITLEKLVPSYKMTDKQMDEAKVEEYEKNVGKVFSIAGHVGVPLKSIDEVASIIQQTGKAVMVWFYFTSSEWGQLVPTVKVPNLDLYANATARHSVAAVDFGLRNGKKVLRVEDSAHFGGFKEHYITEEFFIARNWFARYSMNFVFQDNSQPVPPSPVPVPPAPTPGKPRHTFTKPLEFIALNPNGQIGNLALHEAQKADVMKLQDILRYEGLFPANVASTGYYGATTAKGVYNYQVKHAVAPLAELNAIVPKGGRVGNKTIASLNSRYSN